MYFWFHPENPGKLRASIKFAGEMVECGNRGITEKFVENFEFT
jgi:hypothetical protein